MFVSISKHLQIDEYYHQTVLFGFVIKAVEK